MFRGGGGGGGGGSGPPVPSPPLYPHMYRSFFKNHSVYRVLNKENLEDALDAYSIIQILTFHILLVLSCLNGILFICKEWLVKFCINVSRGVL